MTQPINYSLRINQLNEEIYRLNTQKKILDQIHKTYEQTMGAYREFEWKMKQADHEVLGLAQNLEVITEATLKARGIRKGTASYSFYAKQLQASDPTLREMNNRWQTWKNYRCQLCGDIQKIFDSQRHHLQALDSLYQAYGSPQISLKLLDSLYRNYLG